VDSWLAEAAGDLAESPVLQGLLAAAATLIMEDPTTITCGLLVAEGNMSYWAALIGLTGGIVLGDLALYGIGRYAAGPVARWGIVRPGQIARAGKWYARNLVTAVVVCRFVPGSRAPGYMAAGILHAPFWKFALTVLIASGLWTVALLTITAWLGERILPVFGQFKWPVAIAVILAVITMQFLIARFAKKAAERDDTLPEDPAI